MHSAELGKGDRPPCPARAAASVDAASNRDGRAPGWCAGLPTLLGEGLYLREPTPADARRLARLVTRRTIWRLTPRPPASRAGWIRFVQRLLADRAAGSGLCYVVTRDQTAEIAGLIVVRRLEHEFHVAECQFLFSRAAWRTRMSATSLGYVLDFAFRDTSLHRLECRSHANEEERVLRGLGFVAEGLLRGAHRLFRGFADQTLWSMLRDDWQAKPSAVPRRGPVGDQPIASAAMTPDAEEGEPLPAWSNALPTLAGSKVTLREIDSADAEGLLQVFEPADLEVCVEPPPTTVEMFLEFIAWSRRQRARGKAVCFSIVAAGSSSPIGMLQVRSLDPHFTVAEWGIGLGRAYRGTGAFSEVMRLMMPFVFETLRVHRLEARTAGGNEAAIGSLRRLGAIKEARLRQSFLKDGTYQDDELWAMTDSDWRFHRDNDPERPGLPS